MRDAVRELLVEELRDAYSAEKQALRFMQKVSKQITAPALTEGARMHTEQTQRQLDRLEEAFESLNARPGRKVCEAMRGLIEEALHTSEEQEKGPLTDLVLIAGMQRIEHYEISACGTSVTVATALGQSQVADLLMDTELTEVTQKAILPEALSVSRTRRPAPKKTMTVNATTRTPRGCGGRGEGRPARRWFPRQEAVLLNRRSTQIPSSVSPGHSVDRATAQKVLAQPISTGFRSASTLNSRGQFSARASGDDGDHSLRI